MTLKDWKEKYTAHWVRMNRSLRVLGATWLPLSLAYVTWLGVVGYEVARWAGVVAVIVLGTGYPLIIGISLSVREVRPLLVDDGGADVEVDEHLDEE